MSDTTQVVEREQKTRVTPRTQATSGERRGTIVPAVDVFEDQTGITVVADLPGVSKDRLDVKVQDGNLVIEAQASVPTPDGLRLLHAEIPAPSYFRAFTLSPDFDTAKIEANLQDGVLKLRIPRSEKARPRRIEVKLG
ncbi:Molecular chaperone (small heat shock protein) [Cupriavidus necator H850]|uniref:Hsp20/alpha crystallin family protein n=1 Tax=Cupriavidus necator TaxID=106590 RepID=UPI00129D666B|nr:Hsp20/alpha crystallin family protein [Cupriavidus necator]KAI3606220.1 Molecular chaperone (small heat shock protein) [Cupriavidus necator H850]